jgi:uncharacterized lipoprotein YehR (DUF1307 family)
MKKIVLLFFLLLTISFCYSQAHHVSGLVAGNWDEDTQHWSLDKGRDVDMTITFDGDRILINDQTTITKNDVISRNNNGNEIKTFYNAVDQDERKCVVILTTSIESGKQSISIMYLRKTIQVFYLDK